MIFLRLLVLLRRGVRGGGGGGFVVKQRLHDSVDIFGHGVETGLVEDVALALELIFVLTL